MGNVFCNGSPVNRRGRATRTFTLLRQFFVSALLCLSVSARAQPLEVKILHGLNGSPHAGWDKAMRDLSFSVYVMEPVPPVAISLQGYFTKDREMLWNGYKSAISLCTALALSTASKYTVRRQRPYNSYPGYIDGRDHPHTPSFPSGHTTAAFATATALTLTYKKWYVAVPAYAYAGMAAYARMRLGVHYPTDVLGGMILGTGSAVLVWFVHKRIQERKVKAGFHSE